MIFVFLWLTSLGLVFSRSTQTAANGIISFLFMAEQYSTVYMHHVFSIHSSVGDHLGCSHILAIANSAAIYTEVHVSF